ncbi:hypothetical protein BS78_K033600 [Paspalum vaginatum]|uniref:Uncharacterized protein n=1 Tax=Paspalum vaginatum TaxID=158149 RepID=A0A9W7X9P2_9POAL|nr:hypothetical protein BS78_K033600 [Paspalum vaginatum]
MNNKGNAAAEAALAAAISALKAARESAAQTPAASINPASAATGGSAAASRNNKPAMAMPTTGSDLEVWLKKEKAKKYRRVRLSKDCIDGILSYKSIRPILPPDQPLEHSEKRDAVLYAADADFLQYQRRIREEYEKTGFAYGWETDDEDEEAPRPAPARRRRARPGVMKHKGGTKRLN